MVGRIISSIILQIVIKSGNIKSMKLTKLFNEFFNSEKAGGLILIICTALSLVIANSTWGATYNDFWQISLAGMSIGHWVNDGLMAIFFLLIGLELEREVYKGELSNLQDAMLPLVAAVGGILVPAGIYLFFNYDTPTQSGIGIPMATDIAFALGILSLLGNRVPLALKVFLTALAVIDDLCAILVIAVFYTKTLLLTHLLVALAIFGILLALNRLKVYKLAWYIIGGMLMWYFMLRSGVHAIPFQQGGEKSISYQLQHWLHKPVAFFILPVFALANTAIIFSDDIVGIISTNYSIGIAAGLLVGKPLGIVVLCATAVAVGICKLPPGMRWAHLVGAACLAGIGFTMSIFITLLAFEEAAIINNAKMVILFSSLLAGLIGYFVLQFSLRKNIPAGNIPDSVD